MVTFFDQVVRPSLSVLGGGGGMIGTVHTAKREGMIDRMIVKAEAQGQKFLRI